MVAYELRASWPALSLILIMMIVWCVIPKYSWGGTLYQYKDKDGTIVITDTPPPGVNAKPMQSFEDRTVDTKAGPDKEAEATKQASPKAEASREENRAKISILKKELEQAIKNEAEYRANMNQAHGFAQRSHWRKLVDDELKEIEEKKKKIEELESAP